MSEDNTELKNSDSTPDRGTERDRGGRGGGERELSNGKRDRSRDMLREELTRNLDDAARRSGRPRDWKPDGRPAREAREATAESPRAKDRGQETAGAIAAPGTAAAAAPDISAPPKSWRNDEKRHYDLLPSEIKNAVHRREVEMERGVAELKNSYSEIDAALAPHLPVIKQHGHRPGAAISQLFSWFDYLHKNPLEGFPALVRSMGAEKVFQAHLQQQQAGAQQQQQVDPLDQRLAPYLQHFEQRLGTFQQHVDAQQERAVNDILAQWSKGKTFYEKVRGVMASGIASGAVPLKNGAVDLDGAYQFACAADPEIREQLYAERSAAERKAQREQAERARRAGSSLGGAAPGGNNTIGPKKRTGSRSVRDSIHEAIDEAAGR